MDILACAINPWNKWEELWPLSFPAWSDYYEYHTLNDGHSNRKLRHELAQKRANRRWKKKSMKAARAQGLKKRDRMPGAWPV